MIKQNLDPHHGLEGKTSNRAAPFHREVEGPLVEYFTSLQEFHEPVATEFVRLHTGEISTRNTDTDARYLPPHWSKRQLYNWYLREQGYDVESDGKKNLKITERDDEEWKAGGESPKPHCSWTTFRTFWKTNYPKLYIRHPSEDLCGQCAKYAQAMTYENRRRKKQRPAFPTP